MEFSSDNALDSNNNNIIPSDINIDMFENYLNPEVNEKIKLFYAILHILSYIPIIIFLIQEHKIIQSNTSLITPSISRNDYNAGSQIYDNFINRCKLWVSTNQDTILPILHREECIWAKLWKAVSILNESDLCTVISIVFPTIVKNGFELFPSYFYSLSKYDQFDPTFFINETKLDWPDITYHRMMPPNWKFDHNRPLLGQKYIQREIWKRQHPQSCQNVNFCFLKNRRTGLGSAIHTYAMEMSFCLNQPNTVFAYMPGDVEIWTNGEYCGNESSLECFFEPLTNCSIPKNASEIMMRSFVRSRQDGLTMPSFVRNILLKLPVPAEYHDWYYISAAVMYLMRLNLRTLRWLDEYEKKNLINPKKAYDIGIHVRHGDKGTEMLLVKAKNYMPAVDIIQKVTGKKKKEINVFVSTEDPQVINWFVNYSGCSVSYINYYRNNPGRKGLLNGGAGLTLISLANLRISLRTAIRADTFGSNWDRLVVELSWTYAQRGDALIFEMGVMRSLSAQHYELMKKWKIARKWSYLPIKGSVYEPDDP